MALRYFEGFDYPTNAELTTRYMKPDSYFFGEISLSSLTPMNLGGYSGQFNGGYCAHNAIVKVFDNQPTWIFGAHYLAHSSDDRWSSFLSILDNTTTQVTLGFGGRNGGNLIYAYRGNINNGTQLGYSSLMAYPITYNWKFIEVKVVIHSSSGSIVVKINGNEYLNIPTANTSASGNNYGNAIKFGTVYISDWVNGCYMDNVYICDGSGSINNNFLGDGVVKTLVPNEEGTYSQFTPSSGSNFSCVNDLPTNNTNYVESYTVNHKDSYRYQDLNISGTIRGIGVNVISRKQNLSNINYRPFIITNSTIYTGTQKAIETLTTDYNNIQNIWEVNPYTTNSWSVSDINNLECGVELVG